MPSITRTLNPLPFEHLDPKRFEDLARQLVYEFRLWRRLEATGRMGSDDGFDARGWEVVGDPSAGEDEADAEEENLTRQQDRLWLVQCKREKTIGPTKMRAYLEEIGEEERRGLFGIIFIAACNLSKKTRDVLRNFAAENNIAEWHVWGTSELEDLLFQPKNDHLLFAYFGFSLAIRRRSIRTELRARLATKRKAINVFGKGRHLHKVAVFRDP